MNKDRGSKERVSFKEPKQKGISSETKPSWGSLDIPASYTVLVLGGRDCFIMVGLSTKSWLCCHLGLEEIHPWSREMFLHAH